MLYQLVDDLELTREGNGEEGREKRGERIKKGEEGGKWGGGVGEEGEEVGRGQ